MKVHLIKRKSIEEFVSSNARAKSSFDIWFSAIKFADWNEPNDLLKTFGSADLLGKSSSRIVFNIGGNNYRMICKYLFGRHEVHLFICWIGTHAEYDLICKNNQQNTINIY
ncbi:MAG: type II toxin-antitoxin system HigB family toxin [Bacteroidia bacterium]